MIIIRILLSIVFIASFVFIPFQLIYHKTYITDEMITENKMDYLFELGES